MEGEYGSWDGGKSAKELKLGLNGLDTEFGG